MKKASTRYDVKFTDMQDDENLVFDTADERIDTQPELAFSKKETEKIIKEIIDGLSDEQRVAVLMYFYDGMTTKEIAEEIGCKETTVKARIKYAKEKIKESVVTIQKRDGIKLYNIAPLPFFLLLLKGYSASGFASAVAIGTAATTTATTTASGVATATTTKAAGAVASKGILASTAAKAVLAGAVLIGGGTATYFALNNNNKTYDFVPGYYEDTNGKYSIQLDSDNTFDWYRDEADGRYTSYGTYLIEGNTIKLVIGEVGDRAGTCEFKIGDGSLSVVGGDATECIKGDMYYLISSSNGTSSVNGNNTEYNQENSSSKAWNNTISSNIPMPNKRVLTGLPGSYNAETPYHTVTETLNGSGGYVSISYISYDDDGKLLKIESYENGEPAGNDYFTYNEKGQLVRSESVGYAEGCANGGISFTYDTNGAVSAKSDEGCSYGEISQEDAEAYTDLSKYFYKEPGLMGDIVNTYNEKGLVIHKDSRLAFSESNVVEQYEDLYYDDFDRITKIVNVWDDSVTSVEYTYRDDGLIDSIVFKKYMASTSSDQIFTMNYSYTYE